MAGTREGPAYGIVVAAGKSERMGGVDKLYAALIGRPLLVWSLSAMQQCDALESVVLVVRSDAVEAAKSLAQEWRCTKVQAVVPGGAQRQESVRAGLDAAAGAVIVSVHDGARPLVTPALIAQGVALAREHGAAVCGVPSRDTVKELRGGGRVIERTLARERVWLAQTPQAFDREVLAEAHARATSAQSDDAALVEALGGEVVVYDGAASNIKVTTADDMVTAEALLRARIAGQSSEGGIFST